jgi:DNA-binding transcriptional ArsR family regulator
VSEGGHSTSRGVAPPSGFPRMMARVLICLLVSDTGSLTAAELVRRLQVSPASVSKAVRYLEHAKLVRRERDARQRRKRYLIDDDVWYRAWARVAQAYAMGADTAKQGVEILGADTPAGARLDEMSHFLRSSRGTWPKRSSTGDKSSRHGDNRAPPIRLSRRRARPSRRPDEPSP